MTSSCSQNEGYYIDLCAPPCWFYFSGLWKICTVSNPIFEQNREDVVFLFFFSLSFLAPGHRSLVGLYYVWNLTANTGCSWRCLRIAVPYISFQCRCITLITIGYLSCQLCHHCWHRDGKAGITTTLGIQWLLCGGTGLSENQLKCFAGLTPITRQHNLWKSEHIQGWIKELSAGALSCGNLHKSCIQGRS